MGMWDRLKGADLTYLNKAEFYTLNPTLHEGTRRSKATARKATGACPSAADRTRSGWRTSETR
jgi:hypothetical protein